MKPSDFAKLQNLSLKQRLQIPTFHKTQITEFLNVSTKENFAVPIDEPIFRPLIPKMILQNYEPLETYEMQVSFRNMDKCSRQIRLEQIDHRLFQLVGPRNSKELKLRVAPGMDVTFKLRFMPDQDQDYFTQIVCVTEREKFVIPIEAIGSRAILSMPDEIIFDNSSVKFQNEKIVLVGNAGTRHAKVMFSSESPFTVSPKQVLLAPMENIQLKVVYDPKDMRYSKSILKVKYETGEEMEVGLVGMPVEQDIDLEIKRLQVEQTFVSCASESRFRIINRSKITAPFSWKYFFDEEEERQFRDSKIKEVLDLQNERAKKHGQISIIDKNKTQNAIDAIQQNSLLFEDSTFIVEPREGLVWPNSALDIQIIFKPNHVGVHSATMYCDIAGKASRIPIELCGEANGPMARFSESFIDIGDIFINYDNVFEVELQNIGEIDFEFNAVQQETMFHSSVTFNPSSGVLVPGEKMNIVFNINSNVLGEFCEEFLFEIKDTDDPLILTLKAKIVGPTFRFDKSLIHYGEISCAEPSSQKIIIENTSKIAVNFNMRVHCDEHPHQSGCFKMIPPTAFLNPGESVPVIVEYLPTQSLDFFGNLVINSDDIGDGLCYFPIKAKVLPCSIISESQLISFGEIFVGHACKKTLTFKNSSNMSGRLFIPKQKHAKGDSIHYTMDKYEILIPPYSEASAVMTLILNEIGKINESLHITVRGNPDIVLNLTAEGSGPRIEVEPGLINWDKIPVLQEHIKEFTMRNDSPIAARYQIKIENDTDAFQVKPISGEIQPNSSALFKVRAFLKDSLPFDQILNVHFEPGVIKQVFLHAKGVGNTIVSENIPKKVDFGHIICKKPHIKTFILTNNGKRAQTLVWVSERFPRSLRESNFNVTPVRSIVQPNESVEITVHASCNGPMEDSDVFTCFSTLDGSHAKKGIMDLRVGAKFMEPVVIASSPNISLYAKSNPNGSIDPVFVEFALTNITGIPLNAKFNCPEPFSIIPNNEYHKFGIDEQKKLKVRFDPKFYNSRMCLQDSKNITLSFLEHTKEFRYSVSGIISYPNLKLSIPFLDFGTFEPNSVGTQKFKLYNQGDQIVEYSWEIVDHENSDQVYVSLLPNRGLLMPGETEHVLAKCRINEEGAYNIKISCHIKGGPSYILGAHAASFGGGVNIEPSELNFGDLDYNAVSTKILTCTNTSDVPLKYKIALQEEQEHGNNIIAFPIKGKIAAAGSCNIQVSFCPKTLGKREGCFTIKFGHEHRFLIKYSGTGKAVVPSSISVPSKLFMMEAPKKALFRSLDNWVNKKPDIDDEDELKKIDEITCMRLQIDNILGKMKSSKTDLLLKKLDEPQSFKERTVYLQELTNFTLKEFFVDFGSILMGSKEVKTIDLDNLRISTARLSKDNDFDKFFALEMSSRGEGTQINVYTKTPSLGNVSKKFWFDIIGCPKISFLCTSCVCKPKLMISNSLVDFGSLYVGFRKKISIVLRNPHVQPFKWEIKDDGTSTDGSKKSLSVKPSSGVIQPHESQTIFAIFDPIDGGLFQSIFQFVSHADQESIKLTGNGVRTRLSYEPKTFEISNGIPYGEPVESVVIVKNENDCNVEMVLPDLDLQYLEELKIFETQFGENTFVYIPVKTCGINLKLALTKEEPPAEKTETNIDTSSPDQTSPKTDDSVVLDRPKTVRISKPCILVFGSKISGKTTLCRKLASEHKIPVFSSDEISRKTIAKGHNPSESEYEESFFSELTNSIKSHNGSINGFVIDGVDMNIPVLNFMSKILELLPPSYTLQCVFIRPEPTVLRERAAVILEKDAAELKNIKAKLTCIDDNAYQKLSDSEKQIIDSAIEKYHEIQRVIDAQKKAKQKQLDPKPSEPSAPTQATKDKKDAKKTKEKPLPIAEDKVDNGKKEKETVPVVPVKDDFETDYENVRKYLGPLLDLSPPTDEEKSRASSANTASSRKRLGTASTEKQQNMQSYDLGRRLGENLAALFVYDIFGGWSEPEMVRIVMDSLSGILHSVPKSVKTSLATLSVPEEIILEQKFRLPKPVDRNTLYGLAVEMEPCGEMNDSAGSVEGGAKAVSTKNSRAVIKRPKSADSECRVIMKPQESFFLKLKVNPPAVGTYQFPLNLLAYGFELNYSIPCKLVSSPPQILLEVDDKLAGYTNVSRYLKNINFGTVMIDRPKERNKLPDIPRKSFTIKNDSNMKCRGGLFFKQDVKSDFCKFDPTTFDLSPEESCTIDVHVQPRTVGNFMEQIIICIKDNPQTQVVQVEGNAMYPLLEINPLSVQFDRVILNRTVKKTVDMKNAGSLPLYWRIMSEFPEEVSLSTRHGVIPPRSTSSMTYSFMSTKPVMVKRSFRIEYSFNETFTENLYFENMTLFAEAYDVLLDLHLPKGSDTCIDFGLVRVLDEGKQICILKNKGKYDIAYKFEVDETCPYLTIVPVEGIIHTGEKAANVGILFKSNIEVTYNELPVLKCAIIDPVTKERVGVIPLKISAKCEFSKFQISPVRELAFGPVHIGHKQTKQFTLTNSGSFDLSFAICKESKMKTSKQSKPARASKKEKEESAQFKNFSLTPGGGFLQVGQKVTIVVELNSETQGSFEEVVEFDFSEKSLDPSISLFYKVSGDICIPEITIRDLESLLLPKETGDKFLAQIPSYVPSNTINFGSRMLQTEKKSTFVIENVSNIPVEIACKAISKFAHAAKNDSVDVGFEIEPKGPFTLTPWEQKNVSVIFNPSSMQIYYATFSAQITSYSDQFMSFDLIGEGSLPRVTIFGTSAASKGSNILKFVAGSIGTAVQKTLVLRNDGPLDAPIKLEWGQNGRKDFDITNQLTNFVVKSSDSVVIPILFNASSAEVNEIDLNIINVDNAFENIQIKCLGSLMQRTDLVIEDYKGEDDTISVPNCTVGDITKSSFKVRNLTKTVFRIEWQPLANVDVVPQNFIISGQLTKDMILNISPKVPESQTVTLSGKVTEIRILNRKASVKDETFLMPPGANEDSNDVAFEVIKTHDNFEIDVAYSSVYTQFECPVSDIRIPTTFLNQTRKATIPIRNTGENSIKFQTRLESTNSYVRIAPNSGTIAAGEFTEIEVVYQPEAIGEHSYRLSIDMGNLSPALKPLVVTISGSAKKPICEFFCDYFLPVTFTPSTFVENQYLDANVKNIRILVVGKNQVTTFGVTTTNLFKETMHLEWNSRITNMNTLKCLKPKISIEPDCSAVTMFEHVSTNIGETEFVWNLLITPFNIQIPFTISTVTRDLRVSFRESVIDFGIRPVGTVITKSMRLVNHEDYPVEFSLDTIIHGNYLTIEPVNGKIMGNSERKINVTFTCSDEDAFKLNMSWKVEKKISPLSINVMGSGFAEHVRVILENQSAKNQPIENVLCTSKLYSFYTNDCYMKKITLFNEGLYEIPFKWAVSSTNLERLDFSPKTGIIKSGESETCTLALTNQRAGAVEVMANLTMGETKSYSIRFNGECRNPRIGISCDKIIFNSCYPYFDGNKIEKKFIEVYNSEDSDFVLENKPLQSSVFAANFEMEVLPANKTVKFYVSFQPKVAGFYEETINLTIGNMKKALHVEGRCIDYDIAVFREDMKTVRLEGVIPGTSMTKSVRIGNKTNLGVTCNFGPPEVLAEMSKIGLSIVQATNFSLRPKEAASADVIFSPTGRVPQFRFPIYACLPGKSVVIFDIVGNSPQVDVYLGADHVDFGNVVKTCKSTQQIKIENRGDVPAKFKWKVNGSKPGIFTFDPMEASIGPKKITIVDVIFTPGNEITSFSQSAECTVVGNPRPLKMPLSGVSVPFPPASEVLRFSSPVRKIERKSVVVTNPTHQRWLLKPIIENKLWTGSDSFEIPPMSSGEYKLTYSPQIMTKEDKQDVGSLFIPFPSGSAVLYLLQGISMPPLAESTIIKEIDTKQRCDVDIPVRNETNTMLRYNVELIYDNTNPLISVTAADHIDIPARQTRDYHLQFLGLRAGSYKVQVKIIDEAKEYRFHEITFNVKSKAKPIKLQMITPVRRVISKCITLSNQSVLPTTFNLSCDSHEITYPTSVNVAANSEITVTVDFMPIFQKEQTAMLNCVSNDLGVVVYELHLVGIEPSLEPAINFNCALGQTSVQQFKFIHYSKTKTEFQCKIDNQDFIVEKSVIVSPAASGGSEACLDVIFEPTRLSQTTGLLTLTSPTAGEYFCPLVGQAVLPKPQGPFIVRPGVNNNVCMFKNVFPQSINFTFTIDNPAFSVKSNETIGSKKVFPVSLNYKSNPQNPVKATKLNISHPNGVTWQYYLKVQEK